LAFDIGGANLKVADGQGFAHSFAFALWKDSKQLARELRTLIAESPAADHIAVTMTGELADCFESKAEGVRFILHSLQEAADGRHTRVYLTNGKIVSLQVALQRTSEAAAANWHALAQFACRFVHPDGALLIDIGSTTTDIIPLIGGQAASQGTTDTERLLYDELVYAGIERTPVCALTPKVPFRTNPCPVALELFATTLDAYLLTGELPESPLNQQTADGRPATKSAARNRMGRMIGAPEDYNHRDAVAMAMAVAEAHTAKLAGAVQRVVDRIGAPAQIVISGHGEFVARKVLEKLGLTAQVISLKDQLGVGVSRCAPAHALATLARESVGG
jgi:hypothetical protein